MSSLLSSSLSLEEPLAARPGYQGRRLVQEIDPFDDSSSNSSDIEYYYDAEFPYRDSLDQHLYDRASAVYQWVDEQNITDPEKKAQAIVDRFNRVLLPPNVMRLYVRLYIPPEEIDAFDRCLDDFESMIMDEHYLAGLSIQKRLEDRKLLLSLSFSSSFHLDLHDPKHNRELTFLDVFIGSTDDTQHYLIGSYLLEEEVDFQDFLIDKLTAALKFISSDGLWNKLPIYMVLLGSEVELKKETLAKIHPNFGSVLIVPCLPDICWKMFRALDSEFDFIKIFTQKLEAFVNREPHFYQLFTMEYPDFFNLDLRNNFQVVDFYGRNYAKICEHITSYCMPQEHIHQLINDAFSPQLLLEAITKSSVWQSLVNISVLLCNFWVTQNPDYSALMVALEVENIIRHGGSFLCEELKQLNIERLVLLARLFDRETPLVATTLKDQVPMYHRMFEEYILRGYELEEVAKLHNYTAVAFATKEIFFDYDMSIRDEPHRYYRLTPEDLWCPYKDFGNFELEQFQNISLLSVDDSQLDVIRAIQPDRQSQPDQEGSAVSDQPSSMPSGPGNRKRHHSTLF